MHRVSEFRTNAPDHRKSLSGDRAYFQRVRPRGQWRWKRLDTLIILVATDLSKITWIVVDLTGKVFNASPLISLLRCRSLLPPVGIEASRPEDSGTGLRSAIRRRDRRKSSKNRLISPPSICLFRSSFRLTVGTVEFVSARGVQKWSPIIDPDLRSFFR